jgi:hypothetical protein
MDSTIATLGSLGIGTYYAAYYVCYLAALVLAVLIVCLGRTRLPAVARRAILTGVAVLSIRLVLFDNPGVLYFYVHAIDGTHLGMRQGGMLIEEARKYRHDIHQAPLANLAVGSSQVGAIFNFWGKDAPEPLAVYSLAGMKALDFVLNAERIAAYNPRRIILYVSAFDMTGSPELFSLPLAPPRPSLIWPVYSRLEASGLTEDEIRPTLHAYIASQLLPEYRYAFIYRAMLRQWFGGAPRPVVPAQQRLPEFSNYFDPQWLEYNFLFFHDFMEFCRARKIDVLIVEGQINPAARTPKIDALNDTVRTRLRAYLPDFPNMRYVPAADVYEFSADEYHDTTHVLPDAARKYTARLAVYLTK